METTKTVLTSGGRITVIDALRGFSLIGICLIHSMQHFGAMGTMTPQEMFPWEGTMNEIFRWCINYLVFGKFFIIFSCLFGLSFFIQMDRAAKKGVDFRPRFLWRLVLLLAIGYLHGLFVRVDILLIYALLGFLLVLMYKWPTKLLAGITLFLFLGGATLVPVAYKKSGNSGDGTGRACTRKSGLPSGCSPPGTDSFRNGLEQCLGRGSRENEVPVLQWSYLSDFGTFCLRVHRRAYPSVRTLGRVRSRLNRGGLLALIGLGLLYMIQSYLAPVSWREVSFNAWMGSTVTNLINLLTAYLWVVVVIEAYRFRKVQQAMTPLVSYGRMGLTNYIVQSVIGVFIFSGFGLDWSHLGVFLSVLVCLVYTGVQIVLSHYWLKNFRYGPMEWLWRTGTYLKWQPLLR